MTHLTRDGVALDDVERGTGEPAMVFLHGMACVRQDMDLLVEAFAPEHRCIAFDMRGHGASGVPTGAYATEDFTSDIGFLINELGLDHPVLVGHSFGGSVSLAFAVRTRLFDPVDEPAIVHQVSEQMAKLPAHVFLSMAATVTAFDSAETARQCRVPSLIIQSRQPFVDPAALATLGPNWETGRVVAMIRRFLQLTR